MTLESWKGKHTCAKSQFIQKQKFKKKIIGHGLSWQMQKLVGAQQVVTNQVKMCMYTQFIRPTFGVMAHHQLFLFYNSLF